MTLAAAFLNVVIAGVQLAEKALTNTKSRLSKRSKRGIGVWQNSSEMLNRFPVRTAGSLFRTT
jgi:hypothetical protein